MHSAVVAVIGHAVDNWLDFDAFCLCRGFDPLEIPTRRLVAAAWAWLTEGMDEETKDNLAHQLSTEDYDEPVKERLPGGAVALSPKEKWRAPPGWKPPGWSDEKGMRAAKEFMGFQATVGGG